MTERAISEGPRSTGAVEGQPAIPWEEGRKQKAPSETPLAGRPHVCEHGKYPERERTLVNKQAIDHSYDEKVESFLCNLGELYDGRV